MGQIFQKIDWEVRVKVEIMRGMGDGIEVLDTVL